MKLKKQKAFTLVELIIVITILAILATIAFVSFQGYVKDSRDSTRLTTLKNIESGLQAFQINTGNYPEPENYTLIQASGTAITYQGYVGDTISKLVKINKTPIDPLDQTRFLYATSGNKSKYQLLGYAEKQMGYLQNVYADNYSQRTPKIIGNSVGIFLDNQNTSISGSTIDILTTNSGTLYKVYFGDSETVYVSGNLLFSNIYNRRTDLLQNKDLAKMDESLVLYYDMESTINSGVDILLKDLSKYSNNGKCYNGFVGCTCKDIMKKIGQSDVLSFDGIVDWVELSTTGFSALPNSNFTVSSIVTTTQNLNQSYIINTSGNGSIGFRYGSFDTGKIGFLYASSVSSYVENSVSTTAKINDGNKYLYSMKFTLNDKVETYLNGTLVGTDSIAGKGYSGALNYMTNFWIGKMGGRHYEGTLDDMRIYNRGLSDSEIKELYNSIK